MDTAQMVFSQGATTQRIQSVVPWIVGGLVAVVLLIAIIKWQR